jgi:hypothetical protein
MPQLRCRPLAPILMIVFVGCGQDADLGQVHGTVRLDGKPLTSGTVQFVPDAGRPAKGEVQSDGTYTLGTLGSADGAQVGAHRVAIIAYEASGDSRPAYQARAANKPLVPQKYMAVGTSELTFDVKPGDNQADFELKSR